MIGMNREVKESRGILIGAGLNGAEDLERGLRETWDLAVAADIFIL